MKRLTEPQSSFYHSTAAATAFVAGYGSGKTDVLAELSIKLLQEADGENIAFYEPTFTLMRTIYYPRIEEYLDATGVKYSINLSAHEISVQGLGKIICRSLTDPKKIVGYEVTDSLIDEFDLLPKLQGIEIFNKISTRNRINKKDGSKNRVYVGTTPEGFRATHDLFVKNKREGFRLIKASTYSNRHNLPEDYIDKLTQLYPAQQLHAYMDGEFVNLQHGNVYYAFSREENHTDIEENGKEHLHIGCDFNVGNMHAIVNVVRDKLPFAVDEFAGLLDTPQLIDAIEDRYPGRRIYVYPDSSGKNRNTTGASETDIKQLQQAGFIVCARPANPRIKDRISTMNNLFCNGKGERHYKVNTNKCPVYTEALEQQAYDDNNMPDKKSGLDHPVDAGGYFAHYLYAMNRPTFEVGTYTMGGR